MAVANLLMASKYERHKTEIAELSGKRLVFSDEVDENKELAEARVKDLTGGGRTMRANFMHRDNFDVKKTFTIFLMVTHLPTISGTDKGIWDRIREVPWTVSIPFGEQRAQDDVVAELDADGSWMLHWIVAGYADFQAEPRWIAEEVRAATDFYHIEQDRLLGFITDACEEKPFVHEAKGSLYGAYASWCSANDEQPLSNIDFGKALKTRGIKEKRVGHDKTRVWIGIRLCAGSSAEMRPSAAGSSSNPPSNSSREQSPDAAAASGRNAGQKVP
jgi:putative DNA primase/helicase